MRIITEIIPKPIPLKINSSMKLSLGAKKIENTTKPHNNMVDIFKFI
jgi:hypothetical protein